MDSVLFIDKPKDWTSFDVVAKIRSEVRKITNKKTKVGHAGTLDPMATGLLIVLVGNMTKKQDEFMKKDKIYEAEVTLGATSDTDDAEGKITIKPKVELSETQVVKALQSFIGKIEQVPPQYSAIKIKGQKAYDIARKGNVADVKPRKVEIFSIDNIVFSNSTVTFNCHVSSGTYIRSIARDLGDKLGCGGYLSSLRRVNIGDFSVDNAINIKEIEIELSKKYIASTDTI